MEAIVVYNYPFKSSGNLPSGDYRRVVVNEKALIYKAVFNSLPLEGKIHSAKYTETENS